MVGILQGNLAEDNTKRIKMLVPFPPQGGYCLRHSKGLPPPHSSISKNNPVK
jgi:hypothetical protein